jgi:hypothetical protein
MGLAVAVNDVVQSLLLVEVGGWGGMGVRDTKRVMGEEEGSREEGNASVGRGASRTMTRQGEEEGDWRQTGRRKWG